MQIKLHNIVIFQAFLLISKNAILGENLIMRQKLILRMTYFHVHLISFKIQKNLVNFRRIE